MLGGGGGGGDGGALAGQLAMMAGFSAQLNPPAALPAVQLVGTSGVGALHMQQRQQLQSVEDERVPQWSHQETRDLIVVRAEMEQVAPPRSETIWEAAAARMRDRGHRRTPDQCRSMWSSLVNRHKGKGTSEPEIDMQCPFFEELQAVFAMQAKNMKGQIQASESGEPRTRRKLKRLIGDRSSDEFSVDDDGDADEVKEEHQLKVRKKKADARRMHQQQHGTNVTSNNIQDVVQSFLHQQKQVELQWQETMERRAQERRLFEWEWRQSMEKLERERLMLEQAWCEMEEQRRMREESRAERRDALLTALLSKLIEEDV